MTGAVPFDAKYVSLLWAGPDNAAEIARLHGELFNPAWSEDSVRALLDHPASTAFMAMVGGAPKTCVGFVLAQLAADEAEILTIGVSKDWQRKGVGKRLLEGVMRAAQRAEAKKLYLEVAADNDAAMELYRRAGFLGTGLRRGYYARGDGQAVDAVTFAIKL